MSTVLDIVLLIAIAMLCWRGYQHRGIWFETAVWLWLRLGRGRGLWVQLLIYGVPTVAALLFCHWVNTHGWHATAAGGMLAGMTIGLTAMRLAEEEQKWAREQGDSELQ